MDDGTYNFDAADLADSILGHGDPNWVAVATVEPIPVRSAPTVAAGPRPGRALGPLLAFLLFAAVGIAISLAVQLDNTETSPPPPPVCGGLFSEDC